MPNVSETFELEKENKHAKTDGKLLLLLTSSPLTEERSFTSHARTRDIRTFFYLNKKFTCK